MKKETRVVFSVVAILALVALVTAVSPAPAATAPQGGHEQTAAQTMSVSGKIASVDKQSFTLTVASGTVNQSLQLTPTTPKTMSFLVDKNTTVDGKLQVGASAEVTYREENGQNVAISVRVS